MNIKNKELALKSLNGLWVGDCIGNMGQLYNVTDILKALDEGIVKFGIDNIDSRGHSFQYSDDTDEAIVLLNHLVANSGSIDRDKLAMEFATRFMYHQDGGEYMGYGLMTRKVLTDIYNGVPWREANLTFRKSEGMSKTDDIIAGLAGGKSVKESLADMKKIINDTVPEPNKLVGSCGNGSAMRVSPLGAYFYDKSPEELVKLTTLSAEPTHNHPEGIAGAIAISLLSKFISTVNVETLGYNQTSDIIYDNILRYIPDGEVKNGIIKARYTGRSTQLSDLIATLGNGTHVTCQDTVPLCIFLTIRIITSDCPINEMYEKAIIEMCKCFGDVDTNCAIVGGMVGIISNPPQKWIRYCQPMEGLLNDPLPEILTERNKNIKVDKDAIKEALNNTITEFNLEDQANSLYETQKVIMESLKLSPPTFEEVLENRRLKLNL